MFDKKYKSSQYESYFNYKDETNPIVIPAVQLRTEAWHYYNCHTDRLER